MFSKSNISTDCCKILSKVSEAHAKMTLLKNETVTIQFRIKLKISVLKNSMWMDCSKIAKEVLTFPTVPIMKL